MKIWLLLNVLFNQFVFLKQMQYFGFKLVNQNFITFLQNVSYFTKYLMKIIAGNFLFIEGRKVNYN